MIYGNPQAAHCYRFCSLCAGTTEPSRSDLREFSTQAVETRQELLTSTAAQWRNSAMFQRMVASVYSGPGAVRRRMLMQEHPQLLLTDLDMQLPGMVNLETEEEDRLLQDALLNLRNTLPRRKPHGIKYVLPFFASSLPYLAILLVAIFFVSDV